MRCLKLVVLLFRGYRSRDYFPTRRRDVSATLNDVEFQRTYIYFSNNLDFGRYKPHRVSTSRHFDSPFYCYRILSWYKIVLAFWFFASQQSQIVGSCTQVITRWRNKCNATSSLANNLGTQGSMTHYPMVISFPSTTRRLTLHLNYSNSLLKKKQ